MNQREKGALLLLLGLCFTASFMVVNATTINPSIPVGVVAPDSDYSVYWDESGALFRNRILTPISSDEDMRAGIMFPSIDIPYGSKINNATLSLYFDTYLDEATSDDVMISVWDFTGGARAGVTLSQFDPNQLLIQVATNVNLTEITSPQWIEIDVTKQVQAHVDYWGWELGDSIVFIIYSAENQGALRGYQSNVGLRVPKLEITYGETPPGEEGADDEYIRTYRGVDIWSKPTIKDGAEFVVYNNSDSSTLYILNNYTATINRTLILPRYCAGSLLKVDDGSYYYLAVQTDGIGINITRCFPNGTIQNVGFMYGTEVYQAQQNNRLFYNDSTNTFHCFFKDTNDNAFYYKNATLINGTYFTQSSWKQEIEKPVSGSYDGVGSWVDIEYVNGYFYGATDVEHTSDTGDYLAFWDKGKLDFEVLISDPGASTDRGKAFVEILPEVDQIFFFRRLGPTARSMWITQIPFNIGKPVTDLDNAWNTSEWTRLTDGDRTGSPEIIMDEINGTMKLVVISQELVTFDIKIQVFYDYQIGDNIGDEDYNSGPISTVLSNFAFYRIGNETKMIQGEYSTLDFYNLPYNDSSIWSWSGAYDPNTEIGTLESITFDSLKEIVGSPRYYVYINGTKIPIDYLTDESLNATIDELLGGPQQDDPTPPGSDWEEEGMFTRGKMRMYLFIVGMMLFWFPLFYLAWAVKGGMKIVFIWVVLVCWMLAFALFWSIPAL